MIYKRTLEVPSSVNYVIKLLHAEQPEIPNKKKKEYVFSVRRNALHSGNRTVFRYIISGTVSQNEKNTLLYCSVYPSTLTKVILMPFPVMLISGIVWLLRGADNVLFVGISTLINFLLPIIITWQEKECLAQFETFLRARGQGDGGDKGSVLSSSPQNPNSP